MSTKIFKSGNSLAVRLPRDIAFEEGTEVEVRREGGVITIAPARMDMATIVAKLGASPPPFKLPRHEMKSPKRFWDAE